jgi:FHS family L-fucose permease-like MFS transporter
VNEDSPGSGKNLHAAFVTVTTLFFAWGFITSTIDPLISAVRAIFNLSYTEAMLTQLAFFMSYGIVSLPAAALVGRAGYSRSILIALVVMLVGCLIVPAATAVQRYELVLVALFVIGSGVTVLQLAANPLAAALGPPERSHFRLTFSQAFNSLGTVIGPYLGSMLLLRGGVFASHAGAADAAADRAASLRSIDTSFLLIAVMIALLAVFIWRFSGRLNRSAPPPASADDSVLNALRSRWALLGAGAIFLYVGAEVTIGSIMINFLHQPDVLGVVHETASRLLSFYWFGAMVGRFVGSVLLTRFRATSLLATVAAVAAVLCLSVTQSMGTVTAVCALAVGLFNSIMFPTIFTITLERSTASAAATSGLLCMAIIGGAVLPWIGGHIADAAGLRVVFLLPMVAYGVISLFAMLAAKARVAGVGQGTGRAAGHAAH